LPQRAIRHRPFVEALEDRTLLAVLPSPIVSGHADISSLGGNQNTPAIAIDPADPTKLVTVYTRRDPGLSAGNRVVVQGDYSIDGGQTWSLFALPPKLSDPSTSNPVVPFTTETDASVAFDRNHNFYVVFTEQKGDENTIDRTAGALVLAKYSFSSVLPVRVNLPNNIGIPTNPASGSSGKVLYEWQTNSGTTTGDPAVTPMLTLDNNLQFNPDNGLRDPFAGTVYVAWSTNYTPPTGATGFNANSIKVLASLDGGLSFTSQVYVNNNLNAGSQHDTSPRLVVSGGSTAGATPGQLSIVYDDFGTGATANPPFDMPRLNRVVNGGMGQFFQDTTQHNITVGGTTTIPMLVSFPTNTDFGGLTDMEVTLNITHPSLNNLAIRLTAPTGTVVTLVAAGNITGADMGTTASGIRLGTVFDEQAARAVTSMGSSAPYTDHFRTPTGALTQFYSGVGALTQAQVNGMWTLTLVDSQTGTPTQFVANWSLNFGFGLTPNFTTDLATQVKYPTGLGLTPVMTPIRGALTSDGTGYPLKPAVSPDRGIGPSPVITSDNSQGAFSPYQGRLYLAYVGRQPTGGTGNPTDNTDIAFMYSTDGGLTWTAPVVLNDDFAKLDGFSESDLDPTTGHISGRPQFQPELAVDPLTGTLVATWYDARYDAARARVARYVTASVDGGQTFSPQTYLNDLAPYVAGQPSFDPGLVFDVITRKLVPIGPVPDNQSAGNPNKEAEFAFGAHQSLTVFGGHIYAAWSGNRNGGDTGRVLQHILGGVAIIAGGPRIVNNTMGPAKAQTVIDLATSAPITFNNQLAPDGTPVVDGFVVYFDRPVDPATFDTSQVTVLYRDVNTSGNSPGVTIPVLSVTPLVDETYLYALPAAAQQQFGASKYLVRFAPQSGIGTYSYTVGPNVADRIRYEAMDGGGISPGNTMDQNPGMDPVPGVPRPEVHMFANPRPLDPFRSYTGTYFRPAFSQDTLPIIVPGPHVVRSGVPGNPVTSDNLVLNGTVSSIDVVFDRDMDPRTFDGSKVLRMMGPAGSIGPNGTIRASFTVTPNPNGSDPNPSFPRTYRINFRTLGGSSPLALALSGTYTLVLASDIKSMAGDPLDTNLNAGIDQLRNTPSAGTTPVTASSTSPPQVVGGSQVAQMSIPVADDFLIQGLTVQLNITYNLSVSDLEAFLIAPDGTQIRLFSRVGGSAGGGFNNTIFDDAQTTPDGTNILSITVGAPPFSGRWHAQQPLSDLGIGTRRSGGTWTLRVRDVAGQGRSGTLNNWNITFLKPLPVTDLGEPVADQATLSFRIFTMDPANPLSHNTWTSVGPASINSNGNSGRIGGLAVDPSDPSGNTVYVGGASGGIWKTTNFLTSDPAGPKYIPLTDFGPTFGINIGSIAVFGRNNDPNQSIIFAATGEGDTASRGAGFLRSMDGGATWTLLDSTVNVDSSGAPLPISSPQRDHRFVGMTSFKVLVDPRPSPTGQVLVYAALSGANGGIWRSTDTGKTWTLVSGGVPGPNTDPTDLVFDLNSGHANIISNPTGNLDVIYAAFRGNGVFVSPNRGSTWNELLGAAGGDPLVQDGDFVPNRAIQTDAATHSLTPNGAKGRIVLGKPGLTGVLLPDGTYTGNAVQDLIYEGWLYALVSTPGGGLFDGLYLTKDFGQNWTKVRIPTIPNFNGAPLAVPTNDGNRPDFDPFGFGPFAQGNYDISIGVDPTDPNVIYVGGSQDNGTTGLIRVDVTTISDAVSFFLGNDRNDGGRPRVGTNNTNGSQDPIRLRNWPNAAGQILPGFFLNPVDTDPLNFVGLPGSLPPFPIQYPVINLLRNPNDPFNGGSTTFVSNVSRPPDTIAGLANSGIDAKWIPFDIAGTDQHRMIVIRDPLSGHARIIIGDDQGVYSVVDDNGRQTQGDVGSAPVPTVSRNGNLQITQFYYGASQPSSAAAQIAGALFYGMAQDDGFPQSDPNVLTNGNIQWSGSEGDGTGVATDQTGHGTLYMYQWPCCQGSEQSVSGMPPAVTDFFRISPGRTENGVAHTLGLIQRTDGTTVPDPQWPFLGGFNFAVNPVDPNGIVISSAAGRVFRTTNQGQIWFAIGEPTALDSTNAPALAFGAPPVGAQDPDSLNSFIYAGTNGGHIYVTFTGGGGGTGNAWINISAGLDGSGVRAIVSNPARGSREAYAVTFSGVYYMADSGAANARWQNITGNLAQIIHNLFTPFNDSTQLVDTQLRYLEAIAADWRYAVPDDPNEVRNPVFPAGPTHPVLYVAGEGGVYRSLDKGRTWQIFPNTAQDGARQDGGMLPNAHVTDLDLALGNVNATTGRPIIATPDVLLATTYGRGSFAIRLAPVIIPASLQSDPILPAPFGSTSGKVLQPVIDGLTEQSAFTNLVKIEMFERLPDGTLVNVGVDPNNPNQPFTFTDLVGRFKIQIKPGYLQADGTSDGRHTLVLRGTDAAGVVGEFATTTYNLDTTPFIHVESIRLDPNGPLPPSQGGSDSGLSFTDRITRVTNPILDGQVDQAAPVPIQLFDITDPNNPRLIGSGSTNALGAFSVQVFAGAYRADGSTDGTHIIRIFSPRQPTPSNSVQFTFTLKTTQPPTPPAPDLLPSSNTGPADQRTTRITTPTFFGQAEALDQVQLYANGNLVGTDFVNAAGNYNVTVGPTALTPGTYDVTVRLEDVAGNFSNFSPPMRPQLVIQSTAPTRPTLMLDPAYQMPPGSSTTAVEPQLYDGTADPGTSVVIKDNGVVVDSFRQGSTNTFSRTIDLVPGVHPLTVESSDAVGNTSVSTLVIITVNPDVLDKDHKFIRQLYFNALARPGSMPEWDLWIPVLAQPNGRFLVANAIERSFEGRDRLVKSWYLTYLGRPANGTEERGWAQLMVGGTSEEDVLAAILSSDEYFNRAATIVGQPPSDATFVAALYQQILGRSAAPNEISYWTSIVASQGRVSVAAGFVRSIEYRSTIIRGYYANLLRRSTAPSDQEVAGWAFSGLDFTTIRVGFEASPEFYFRVTGFLP
jgi:subtilisin-like proprotein convertase family protein